MSRMLPLSAALVLCLGVSAFAAEPQTIELRAGRYWEPVKTPTTAPVTDETLDRVGQILETGNARAAKQVVLNWIKRNPKDHPLRDRALYLLGVANFQIGERIESFYDFEELLDLYPDSKYYYPALEKQYEIGDAFLAGFKLKFLWMPILPAQDEGVEILFRVQQRSPGSPLAEKALKRTADYYYADAQYDLAADAYQAFVDRYPRSPDVPQVRLKKAFSQLAQFRGTRFDPTPIINARAALEEIQMLYPEMARQENLSAVIERIDSALARKGVQIGDFYQRTREPRAAAYQYKYVIETYPNFPEAQQARTKLASLPPDAQRVTVPAARPLTVSPPETRPATRPASK